MATNKPKIQAYIDAHYYQLLEAYRQEQNLSQSQAIEKILTTFFGEQSQITPDRHVLNCLDSIQQQLVALGNRLDKLEAASESSSELFDELPSESSSDSVSELPILSNLKSVELHSESSSELPVEPVSELFDELPSESSGESSSELPTSSDRMVVCKFYKNAAKDPQSWHYWAGPKNGFVESLDKANTYTLRGAERVVNQLLDDVMHKPSNRERISCRALEELRVFAKDYETVC